MAKVRVKLHRKEIRKLLRGEGEYSGVRDDLLKRGEAVAEAAGPGMEVDSAVTRTRFRVSVRTATPDAVRAEATDRTLTKALDKAR